MANKFHLQAIISAVDKITPTLRGMRRGLNATHKAFKDLGGASRNLLGSVGLPMSLGFAAMGYGALNAARSVMAYSASIQDAVDVTSIQAEELQRLQGAFRMGGVEAEATNDAIVKFTKGIADAASGENKGLAQLMVKLKIPLRDAKGEIRAVTDVLPEFAEALKANENPGVRTRMAMEAFGKTGAKLLPTLAAGKEGLLEMMDAQKSLGKVIQQSSIDKLDKLDEALGELGVQYRTQTAEMFAMAAPAIMPALKALEGWIAANREMLQQRVGGYISAIADAFQKWVESGGIERLGNGILRVVDGIGSFVDTMGGAGNVMIGFGAILAAGPIAGAIQFAAVLGRFALYIGPMLLKVLPMVATGIKVIGSALLANPILAIIAGIAAAAFLIYSNWGTIGPWVSALWDQVKGYFAIGWEAIKTVFSWSPLGMLIKNWEPIVKWFSGMWDRVRRFVDPIMSAGKAVAGWFGGGDGAASPVNVPQPVARLGPGGRGAPYAAGSPQGRTPLGAAGALAPSANLTGEMRVRFENSPPGMRVDQSATNQRSVMFNPDVGYRMATG